jgi:hypothetical protein
VLRRRADERQRHAPHARVVAAPAGERHVEATHDELVRHSARCVERADQADECHGVVVDRDDAVPTLDRRRPGVHARLDRSARRQIRLSERTLDPPARGGTLRVE